jgi:hypothetical protein
MPVIGGAFSCGFSKAADSVIGIILGLAQRNRGRKTSDPDACGASAAPGKMRAAASRNQRRAGKIVPGFSLDNSRSRIELAASVKSMDRTAHHSS